jgi:hypothetical protein
MLTPMNNLFAGDFWNWRVAHAQRFILLKPERVSVKFGRSSG